MKLSQKLHDAQNILNAGDTHQAIALLDDLHVECHAEAVMHMRTHVALANAHFRDGNYRRAAFELLALPFAGPASLAHKYLGVSRKL